MEITKNCRNLCVFCSNKKIFNNNENITLYNFENYIKKVRPYLGRLKITGGEPTLHPNLFKILDFLEKEGVTYYIFTNAFWDKPYEIVNELKGRKFFRSLLVSIHSLSYDTNLYYNPDLDEKKYALLMENIDIISKNIPYNLNCILNMKNLLEIPDLIEFSIKKKANSIVFERYIGNEISGFSIDKKNLKTVIERVERFIKHYEKRQLILWGSCIPSCFVKNRSSCWGGKNYFTITTEGKIRPCNHSPVIIGDLNTDDFEELVKGKNIQNWLKAPLVCQNCEYKKRCEGGCRAQRDLNNIECDELISLHERILNTKQTE